MSMNRVEKQWLSDFLTLRFQTEEPNSHWFGYYNYSPISKDGQKLLSHEVVFDGRDISPDDTADIGWFELESGAWHKVATTRAINWQQGAMLQWLGPDYSTRFIYNDVDGNHFCSRIYDVTTGEMRTIPFPIYGVSPDGKFSITLQFERCAWCRAYHYESIHNEEWNVAVPERDGIFRIDLETGSVSRIIGIAEVVAMLKPGEYDGTESHWFEHIMLNPSGTRFAFYHRYGHGYEFNTIAYTANVDGSNLRRIPCESRTSFSHLGWRSDDEFVVYTSKHARLQKGYIAARKSNKKSVKSWLISILRPVVRMVLSQKARTRMMVNAYYVFTKDCDRVLSDTRGTSIFKYGDGHPSFTKDGRYMLTDTYSDEKGFRNLLLYDVGRAKIYVLAKLYSPYNCCGYRSDLHPRFSHDERYVIVDSAHTGRHQLYVYNIDWGKIHAA